MSSLSSIGIVHTLISVVALASALQGFLRDGRIDPATRAGQVYLVTTILTCLSGFFIFAHGGFGKPHALGVITLGVLALAALARSTGLFGHAAASVEMVSYSLTVFFHLVPAVTEAATRLPAAAPLVESPEAPQLAAVHGVLFVLFLLGARYQVRKRRASASPRMPAGLPE